MLRSVNELCIEKEFYFLFHLSAEHCVYCVKKNGLVKSGRRFEALGSNYEPQFQRR